MRRNAVPIFLLSFAILILPAAHASEKSFGFFNLKKSEKKKPAQAVNGNDTELTQEEKELLKKMTDGKAPAKYPAVPRRAPQQPVPPPKDPNDFLVRIPQPPPHAPKESPDAVK